MLRNNDVAQRRGFALMYTLHFILAHPLWEEGGIVR
jgi:hypothetical protein